MLRFSLEIVKQEGDSSVNILRRLVFTAASVGAEQFIRIIFGTSNGRVIYETYKSESPLPEEIASAYGHDSLAAYLISQTKRYVNYYYYFYFRVCRERLIGN